MARRKLRKAHLSVSMQGNYSQTQRPMQEDCMLTVLLNCYYMTMPCRKYNKAGMTYLFDLDFHHLRDGKSDEEWTTLYTVDAYHAGNVCFLSTILLFR